MYVLDNYNGLDFLVLSLYLASYALRFLVDRRVKDADNHYNGTTSARDALARDDFEEFIRIRDRIFDDSEDPMYSYFMRACKTAYKRALCTRTNDTTKCPHVQLYVLF